jgi:hypothetical protein
MKLELKPEIHARGVSLEAYLDEVLTSAAAVKSRPTGRKSLAQLFAVIPQRHGLTVSARSGHGPSGQSTTGFLLDTNVPSELTRAKSDPALRRRS